MQPIPVPPNPSDPLRASFGRAVVVALQERTVRAGPGLYSRTGPGGTVIGLLPEDAPGAAAQKTDTAVAAASEDAPQNRSVEVRAAVAATEADPAAGTDATPAAPAALQLYRFDEPEPDKGDGISATVTVPEKGGTCTVDFGLPAGATPGSAEIMLAARRIDPDTGARSLAWLKLGVAPGEEDGAEGGGGEDEPEVEPPPCGNPLNGPESDPTPEPEGHTAIEDSDPPLDESADPTPGDGGKAVNPLDHPGDGGFTPTCGGDSNDEAI